jgi:FkbM family methyltransferase
MTAYPIRRTVGDVVSVCRSSDPATAAHWVTALVTHLPECMRCRSLRPADEVWERAGAQFRTSTGALVSLPAAYTPGAREMYCRNVYLRTGLTMPSAGWVIDLGANRGLFSVWAALTGARVIAVEAQQGFASEIHRLAVHNGVEDRISVETAVAGGVTVSGSTIGLIADDDVWATASHGTADRPADVSVPGLMSTYQLPWIDLLKMDIEGGEFAVLAAGEDLRWLRQVRQMALEVHTSAGNVPALIQRLRAHGFIIDLRDNDGNQVAVSSEAVNYAYCSRPGMARG